MLSGSPSIFTSKDHHLLLRVGQILICVYNTNKDSLLLLCVYNTNKDSLLLLICVHTTNKDSLLLIVIIIAPVS